MSEFKWVSNKSIRRKSELINILGTLKGGMSKWKELKRKEIKNQAVEFGIEIMASKMREKDNG